MNKIDIGIQIVNYNTKKYTQKCIEDILIDLKGSKLNYQIFVLDNNSDDDLSDLEVKYVKENIVFLKSNRNGGFGYGHNQIAQTYNAKYMLLVNPDIEFTEKNTIERVYQYIEHNYTTVKIVGINSHGPRTHGNKMPFNSMLLRLSLSRCIKTDKITDVNWVQGSFLMMDKKIFDMIGGFDESFFLYMEEIDLAFRVMNLGYRIVYNPKINIYHHGGVVASKSKYMRKSILYFLWKWFIKWYPSS